MRTACAEHRLAYGQGWKLRRRGRGRGAQKGVQACADAVHAVLARRGRVPGQLAADADRQMVPAGKLQQGAFDHGIELLQHEHFVQPLQKRERKLVGKGEGRGHLEHFRRRIAERVQEICVAHAAGGDAFAARARHGVFRVSGQSGAERGVARFDLLMVEKRGAREDDPARIPDKALRRMRRFFLRDSNGRVPVADAGGGAQNDRRAVLLGEPERVCDHGVRLLG